jgi:amidase
MSPTRREVLATGVALAAAPSWGKKRGATMSVLDNHDSLGLAALVHKKEVSPGELLEAAIARAEALNPRFNFMAQRHYDRARRAVADGLPDGTFKGVPWLIKDLNTYIAGEVTENGSRLYKGYRPSVTSELVKRIERAGFVIFGKTASPNSV